MTLIISAVFFAIPTMATIAENNSALLCVEMSSSTEAATLGLEVEVTLFSIDGTGMYVFYVLSRVIS